MCIQEFERTLVCIKADFIASTYVHSSVISAKLTSFPASDSVLWFQTEGGESLAARQQEARRRALARRRAQGQQTRNARLRLNTPPPVSGRKHETVQTERYLEEVSQ